jgi:hypothetical protein
MGTIEEQASKITNVFDKLKENSFVLQYRDGTRYLKLPNGVIKRISKRAYQIRKNPSLNTE